MMLLVVAVGLAHAGRLQPARLGAHALARPLQRRCATVSREAKGAKSKAKEVLPQSALEGQTLELLITSLSSLGDGVARTADGFVVLVPFVIPGERVLARVFRVTTSYASADLVEVVAASAERVAPRCALFGTCGGCQYQHMPLHVQREWKRQHVIDALSRIGGFTDEPCEAAHPLLCAELDSLVRATAGADEAFAYGYRSKITPHHEGPRGEALDVGAIGFREANRRRLVDVPACPISSAPINAALPAVREAARARARDKARAIKDARDRGERRRAPVGATLLLRDADGGVETDANALVRSTVNNIEFHFPAGEFFQNNPSALPALVEHVVRRARAGGRVDRLVDAYCGGGFFALCAARHFESVVGLEISADNVRAARANAERNGIANVRFEAGGVEDLFAPLVAAADAAGAAARTTVILDPPRKGCSAEFLAQLFAFRPARVVYVSCDPATQARDAVAFARAEYSLRDVQPFDLFPQTRHIECVCVFDRAGDGEPLLPLTEGDAADALSAAPGAYL